VCARLKYEGSRAGIKHITAGYDRLRRVDRGTRAGKVRICPLGCGVILRPKAWVSEMRHYEIVHGIVEYSSRLSSLISLVL